MKNETRQKYMLIENADKTKSKTQSNNITTIEVTKLFLICDCEFTFVLKRSWKFNSLYLQNIFVF